MITLYLKHCVVGTPFETPLRGLKYQLDRSRRRRSPGLERLAEEDRWIDSIIDRELGTGDVAIDVGSHLGSMVGMMLRRVRDGRVHAIEPDAQKAGWLRKKFPSAKVHCCAVGDEPGTAKFFVHRKKRGFSGLQKHGPAGGHDQREVRVERLDDLLADESKLKLIKIDIEGGELGAFRGAVRTLARCRPLVVFECTLSGMEAFGYTSEDMWDFWTDQGYTLAFLEDYLQDRDDRIDRAGFAAAHVYPWRAFNFVAVPGPTS